jgi:molybdate transport repressor ModE-like protein
VLDPLRLRLLVEVERHGSITAAAHACSMGQPTASQHLRTLEAAVGHRLFERAGRGTQLTDAGRLLARHASLVLSELDGLEQELAELGGGRAGTVRVAACEGFGNYILPRILAGFVRDHPRADVQVRVAPSGEVVRCVAKGIAHVGVAGPTRHVRRTVTERLMRDDLVGVAAPLHDALHGVVEPAQIDGLALVVPGPESSSRGIAEDLLSAIGHRPARLVEFDSIEAVKQAVRSGLGVAFLSQASVAGEVSRGELQPFRIAGLVAPQRWLDLVLADDRRPTPLEAAFAALLRSLRDQTPLIG